LGQPDSLLKILLVNGQNQMFNVALPGESKHGLNFPRMQGT
jgi:hypothetical protein